MPVRKIIMGAGSAGRAALSNLRANHIDNVFFLDDNLSVNSVNDAVVLDKVCNWRKYNDNNAEFLIAFGTSDLKYKIQLFNEMEADGALFFNAIHPSAVIDEYVNLGRSVVVSPNVSIMSNAKVGDCTFICANCSIDHDCNIGDGIHVSPGVNLAGGVTVGNSTFLGTNSSVIPCIKIGSNVIVGAGAVVTKDIDSFKKVAGVPAKDI